MTRWFAIEQNNMPGFFEVKIKINTPANYIWKVITDFSSYSDWNPFLKRIDGKLEVGASIDRYLKLNPKREKLTISKEMIVSLKENQHLSYGTHFFSASLYDSMHWQTIQVLASSSDISNNNSDKSFSCLYHSYHRLSGIASWPMAQLLGEKYAVGARASGIALKQRAEYLYQQDAINE